MHSLQLENAVICTSSRCSDTLEDCRCFYDNPSLVTPTLCESGFNQISTIPGRAVHCAAAIVFPKRENLVDPAFEHLESGFGWNFTMFCEQAV